MRKVLVGLVNICIVISCFTPLVFAKELLVDKGLESLLFEEIPIVVGISKRGESLTNAPMSVYVVTKEEMDRWGVHRLSDILDRVPGVYSWRDFIGGSSCDNRCFRGVMCTWATGFGIELAPVYDWGHVNFPANFFKSVEVARGPASITWGAGSSLGMINLNFRDDLEGLETIYEIGNAGQQYMDVLFGKKFEDGEAGDGLFVGIHQKEKDPEKTENSIGRDGFVRSEGYPDIPAIVGKVTYNGAKFFYYTEEGNSYDPLGPDSHEISLGFEERTRNLILTVYQIEYKLPIEWPNITLYHSYYEKEFHRSQYVTQSLHHTRLYGFRSTNYFLDDKLTLDAGGNFHRKDTYNDPSYRTDTTTDLQYLLDKSNAEYWDYYLQGTYDFNNHWTAVLGGQLEYQKNGLPTQHMFSGPRIAVLYHIDDTSGFKYIYSNASRRPRGNEQAYADINDQEILEAHDLVWYMNKDKYKFDVTLYSQEFENTFYSTLSANSYKGQGIELSSKYNPIENLLLYCNGSYALNDSSSNVSNLYMPQFTAFAGAEYTFPYVKLNLSMSHAGAVTYYNGNQEKTDTSLTICDLTLRTTDKVSEKFYGSLIVHNLFDNHAGMPYPDSTTDVNYVADPATHAIADNNLVETEGILISVKLTYKW